MSPRSRARLVQEAACAYPKLSPEARYALRRVAAGRGDAYDVDIVEDAVAGRPASWRGKRFDAGREQARAINTTPEAGEHLACRRADRLWKLLGAAICAASAAMVIGAAWGVLS